MKTRDTAAQRIAKSIPVLASILGMGIIMGSITVFFDDSYYRVAGVTAGIFVLLLAVWYAANPFLFSTRRYLQLRVEVVRFIGLVRELNNAVVAGAQLGQVEQAQSALHEAVDRIAEAAGKTDRAQARPALRA